MYIYYIYIYSIIFRPLEKFWTETKNQKNSYKLKVSEVLTTIGLFPMLQTSSWQILIKYRQIWVDEQPRFRMAKNQVFLKAILLAVMVTLRWAKINFFSSKIRFSSKSLSLAPRARSRWELQNCGIFIQFRQNWV